MRLDLPLDAHLHTDLSHDSDVPIDLFAALAREQGVAELAITDHLDFDPGDVFYSVHEYTRRERVVRVAAERWEGRPLIRFGVELTYERRLEATIRDYLDTHPYDFVLGSVHLTSRHPLGSYDTASSWVAGKTHREASAWYWDEAEAAVRSGLFDAFAHLDVVKRYLFDHLGPFSYEDHADLYDRVLIALVETGTALEVNSSGLRQAPREAYPSPVVVERFRKLGGIRVTAGSDAHRMDAFGSGLADAYRYIADAGIESLGFRRGSERVEIPIPTPALPSPSAGTRG